MSISIGHLAITVADMEKSIQFYSEGLGYKRVFDFAKPETGEPWIVYLYAGGEQFIELFYDGENDYKWDIKDRAYNHVCLVVDDMNAAVAKLNAAGIALDKQPKQGVDGNWQCWLTDPDGVRIEIMQLGPDSPQARVIQGKPLA